MSNVCVDAQCWIFSWEHFHNKDGRQWSVGRLFLKIVWSLYILFIRRLASLKGSRGTCSPITSGGRRSGSNREEEEILKALLARLHKQVTVYILHGGNKERSRTASKDIAIFYLLCSRNRGKRESGVLADRGICCRMTTFLSAFHIWRNILCLGVMINTNVRQWDGASLGTLPSPFSPPFQF